MSVEPDWHFVTCEYPPSTGGVADFTRVVAAALAESGRVVHVWSPPPTATDSPVPVHELPGGYRASRLPALSAALDACPTPRRLFVQWVPHGYGYKALNVPFCLWVRQRARRGDEVHLMVHEPFLPFDVRRVRQNIGAAVHRGMLRLLTGCADAIWVSTPAFLPGVRRFAPPAARIRGWLPVPSPLPCVARDDDPAERRRQLAGGRPLVGHFGTCNPLVAPALARTLARIVERREDVRLAIVGRGSRAFVAELLDSGTVPPASIAAQGELPAAALSTVLQCCDVFVQPYPDGATARRTTLMALLQHGCAVVTTESEQSEAYWSNSEAVHLTPAGDAASLAAAALALLDDPGRRRQLACRARRLYAEQFDVRRTIAVLTNDAA